MRIQCAVCRSEPSQTIRKTQVSSIIKQYSSIQMATATGIGCQSCCSNCFETRFCSRQKLIPWCLLLINVASLCWFYRLSTSSSSVHVFDTKNSAFPGTAVINFPFGITANRYKPSISESFWTKIGEWEKSTFATFHQYIHANTTVIDFGGWIGPTVLFSANLARRVIAFECDPYAMAELSQSVLLNPRLSHKISLSRLCISDKRERLQMSGHGGSGSTLNSVSVQHFQNYKALAVSEGVIGEKYEWEVDCVPLSDIIEENHITGDIFVKIDTEGAEAFIVPSLKKWLESRRDRLPTIFVSMHNGFSHLDKKPELLNGFLEIFKMYEKVMLVHTHIGEAPILGSQWTAERLAQCSSCDIIMTS
jgi:FkbM family methyltransferase